MKTARNPKRHDGKSAPRRVIQSIIASPGLKRIIKFDELKYALVQHRLLDRLPCRFRNEKGKPFIVVSTTDLRKTLLFLPREREAFLTGVEIRELTASTVAE